MPKPRKTFLDLSFVTDMWFPTKEPHVINNGNCFNWAFAAYIELIDTHHVSMITLPDTPKHGSHAFVKINDNFFDAEAPKGVMAWRYLPFVRLYEEIRKIPIKNNEVVVHGSVYEFIEYWDHPNLGNNGALRAFIKKNYPSFDQLFQNRSRMW